MSGRWQIWTTGVLAACFLSVVLAHAYVGSFSRFMADTYCYAADVTRYGFIGAQQVWYNAWTGRFAFSLGESLTGWIGPRLAPVLPALVLLLWIGALGSIVVQFHLLAGRLAALCVAALLSALAVAVTLSNIPLVQQSLYWSDGMTNYVPPLILCAAYASLLLYAYRRAAPSKAARLGLVIAAAMIAFVAGGFSEMYGALQLSALLGVLLAIWVYGAPASRGRLLPLSAAGLLGGALALVVVILAPGNKVRAAFFPPPPHLLALIELAGQLTVTFLQGTFVKNPLNLGAAVVIPGALAAWLLDEASVLRFGLRALTRVVLWTPLVSVGLLLSAFAAAAYGISGPPPARALVVPQFFLVASLMLWGFVVGGLLRRAGLGRTLGREAYFWKAALGGVLVVFGLHTLQATQQALSRQPVFQAYALAWDETYRLAQDAHTRGLASVSLPPLANPSGVEEAGADPNFWVNQCVSQYYGLSVVAHPPLPAPSPAELQRSTPLDGHIADVAQVEGYALDKDSLRAGETLSVTVYWRPEASTDRPYTVFVHLYDPASGSIAQVDTYPVHGAYPTTVWVYDHVFADTYQLMVPAQLTVAHNAEIVLGLYDLTTLQRLPVTGQDTQADQSWVHFGSLRINP